MAFNSLQMVSARNRKRTWAIWRLLKGRSCEYHWRTARDRCQLGSGDKGSQGAEMDKDEVDKFFMPKFCKHLYMRNNVESVQIPTEFLDKIKEEVPVTAILRGPFGSSWPVKIHQEKNGIFLADGWENFRLHHSLVSVSFLVFRYCGNWCFEVDIFADSGLEKQLVDAGGNNEAGPSGVVNKRGRRGRRGKTSVGSVKDNLPESRVPDSGDQYRSRTTWHPELLSLYLDSCLAEAAKERTASGNLTQESWKKVQAVLKETTSMDFTPMQLLNKWNSLRRTYIVWSKIIAEARSGEYDPVANQIKWNKKQWKEYIKVNPLAEEFRKKSLAYPEKMKLLFSCYVAAGEDGGNSCEENVLEQH